jgi:hypothetical protein
LSRNRLLANQQFEWRTGSADTGDGTFSTQRRRWNFSSRSAGPLSKRSFADRVEKSAPCDSGHSQVATADRDTIAAERLHLKAANSRIRPTADFRVDELGVSNGRESGRCCRAV